MNMERPQSELFTERPKTRWSREPLDSLNSRDRSSAIPTRPTNKMERPQSRRGVKMEIPEGTEYQRPVSTNLFANSRVSAVGSRLNSATRLNTGYTINTQRAFDRPATGVRPGSTIRGFPRLSRLVQDKRYYEGVIQLKIRELTQEVDNIKRGIERQMKEKATFVHFDRRAKDLASELSDLQGQLADYNTVLDKMTLNTEKSEIEQAANELSSINERKMFDIEEIFEQRQKADQKLRNLQTEIDQEKRNAEKVVMMMDAETRAKYDKLYSQKMQLKQEIDNVQREVDLLISEKNKLEEEIALSQVKQEAVKLHVKIMEIESKRDRLLEECQNKLSPENEKNKLFEKVKQDNVEITAAENQLAEIKKRTEAIEQKLEQLEKDLEGNYSEKGAKYKEFHKREQIMEEFLSTFDADKAEEEEKLGKLEKSIVGYLEKMASKMEGTLIFNDEDIFDIQIEEKTSPRNLEDLKVQYVSMQNNFLKMKALEAKFKTEIEELKDKMEKKKEELKGFEDLNKMKMPKMSKNSMAAERESLMNQEKDCDEDLKDVREELAEIEERLSANEIYGSISLLEQRLETVKQSNEHLKSYIQNQRERLNYIPLKKKTNDLIYQHNTNFRNVVPKR